MGFEIKGLDEMMKKLEDLMNRVNAISGEQHVPFSELFDQNFMAKHTEYVSIEEFINASGYEVHSEEDFKAIPDAEFDKHVMENTDFDSWEEMMKAAATEYYKKQLGFE